jgi:hypothetical protein
MFHRLSRNHATDGALRTIEKRVITAIVLYLQRTPNARMQLCEQSHQRSIRPRRWHCYGTTEEAEHRTMARFSR